MWNEINTTDEMVLYTITDNFLAPVSLLIDV